MRATVRLVSPTARAQSVAIEIGTIPSGARVWIVDAELQQVLMNLLVNAIQACREKGLVRVEVEEGTTVRIRVRDNGCGIPIEDQERIFEPFVGLRTGGTGLGLFLSLNLVRRWGGEIVLSSRPGIGSTFEIRLPSVESGLPPLEEPGHGPAGGIS